MTEQAKSRPLSLGRELDIRNRANAGVHVATEDVDALLDELDLVREERGRGLLAARRIRAQHERRESHTPLGAYCDLCSNHGDITWPCATISALESA
ncbi:hypothetical protein ABZ401_19315 [Streptomyces sp. NPDC005892]|uniref:hypothetical protein n=1 Tax=Streptomyces sp. NPDC005892 TaxID=3155593 RepID=UPI003401FB14